MGFATSHTDVERVILERALTPGAHVLDAGCGRTTRLRLYRGSIERLIGVDLDEQAGIENTALDEFVRADLCTPLPYVAATFDLVYSNFVVEHLADPGATMAEWHRVLRPGGSLVLLTSNRSNPLLAVAGRAPHALKVILKRLGAGVREDDVIPTAYRANSPPALDALARAAGFEPVEVAFVATLHRYAARLPPARVALLAFERLLPERRRSTIVAWYRRSGGS